jgi:hypothetical protein
VLHPHLETCWSTLLDRFTHVFKWIPPIYYALHFLPPILLRWQQFRVGGACSHALGFAACADFKEEHGSRVRGGV